MSEEMIIDLCAPTLAGIKTGNLFSVKIREGSDINREIRALNEALRDKGIRVIPLKKTESLVLIYLYRPDCLRRDLDDPDVVNLLKEKGYVLDGAEDPLVQLARHLREDKEFPHEIGVFLGYPPSDVASFMKSSSEGVKCVGCWKAYSDREKAERTFRKYQTCTEIYRRLNRRGKSLAQLAVATTAV
ncbi:MAG: DUF3793 family protein [Lachnospiraceae bacterium]|nr:DUF3793 family protein [Lachnospiraceae bacterium]